jgi:hypothetical protein
MLMIVLFALFSTCLAYIGADSADLFRKWAPGLHCLSRKRTKICTLTVKPDAAGHHLYILFLQTGIKAYIACIHAFKTSLYTFFIN